MGTRNLVAFALTVVVAAPLPCGALCADKFKLETLKEAPPKEVSETMRGAVSTSGSRILDSKGKPLIDVWLRRALDAGKPRAGLGIRFGSVKEGAFLGVIRYHKKTEDFRAQEYEAGTYTIRYAVQPEDGDHMGVSDTRDFLLLCEAKSDTDLEPLGVKELVKRSSKVAGGSHPAVIYLVEHFQAGKNVPQIIEDADTRYWLLECEIPQADGEGKADPEKKPLRLWIVFDGTAPDFQ